MLYTLKSEDIKAAAHLIDHFYNDSKKRYIDQQTLELHLETPLEGDPLQILKHANVSIREKTNTPSQS